MIFVFAVHFRKIRFRYRIKKLLLLHVVHYCRLKRAMGCVGSKTDDYELKFDTELVQTNATQKPTPPTTATQPQRPSLQNVGRRKSVGSINPIDTNNPVPIARIGRRTSDVGLLSRTASSTAAITIVTSEKYPWIIKEADFSGNNKLSMDRIDCCRVIGTGIMGAVRMTNLKGTKQYFALKSIRKDYIEKHNDHRHIKHERELLAKLKYVPFCIQLLGTFQDDKNVYFALELAAGGELLRRLVRCSVLGVFGHSTLHSYSFFLYKLTGSRGRTQCQQTQLLFTLLKSSQR